jgi:hypothetical protein
MEPLHSMQTAAWLLGIGAAGGLVMAGIRWTGKPHPPTWIAMVHGLIGAAALTLLLYAWWTVGLPLRAQLAAVLLLVAAAGGAAINLMYHWRMLPLPKSWIVVHALLAVAGFLALLSALMGPPMA